MTCNMLLHKSFGGYQIGPNKYCVDIIRNDPHIAHVGRNTGCPAPAEPGSPKGSTP